MVNSFQVNVASPDILPGIFAPVKDDDLHLEIRVSRRFTFCAGISVLFHAMLFLAPLHSPLENDGIASQMVQGPLTVRLGRPDAAPAASEPTPQSEPIPEPPPPQKAPIALARKGTSRTPAAVPTPVPAQETAAPTDMMAMLDEARQRRRAETVPAETTGDQGEISAEDRAAANIKNDVKRRTTRRGGTNGVFQILSKGTRNARFSFRGWQTRSQNNWRETIDVDAGPNGNVELAIVRKMIELIRKHYSGDFSWESHRLGRVLILSARPQDSAELEAFLMLEFFEGDGR